MTPIEYLESKVFQELRFEGTDSVNYPYMYDFKKIFFIANEEISKEEQLEIFSTKESLILVFKEKNIDFLITYLSNLDFIEKTYQKYFPLSKNKLIKISNLQFKKRGSSYFSDFIRKRNFDFSP